MIIIINIIIYIYIYIYLERERERDARLPAFLYIETAADCPSFQEEVLQSRKPSQQRALRDPAASARCVFNGDRLRKSGARTRRGGLPTRDLRC